MFATSNNSSHIRPPPCHARQAGFHCSFCTVSRAAHFMTRPVYQSGRVRGRDCDEILTQDFPSSELVVARAQSRSLGRRAVSVRQMEIQASQRGDRPDLTRSIGLRGFRRYDMRPVSCPGIHTGLPSSREPDAMRLKIFPMVKCRNYSA